MSRGFSVCRECDRFVVCFDLVNKNRTVELPVGCPLRFLKEEKHII